MPILSLNQKNKRVQIEGFEVENQIVFNFFDKLPASERDEKLLKAINIGVLALMEDRLSSFLSKTSNQLGTELESLKMIFDMKQELFFKSAVKGMIAEDEIANFLNQFFSEQRLLDKATLSGNTVGKIPKNKTGDIICFVNGKDDLKIVIECKFDKSLRLGNIESKDVFTRKTDTAWSQLIEAQANRDGKVSIIVLDISVVDAHILNTIQNVRYIPAIGLISIIDSQKGDFSNLAIAYMLARDLALNAHTVDLDKDLLAVLINRIIKDISDVISIKNLVLGNIENNKKILSQLERSLLSMDFNQKYLQKFLNDGQMSKQDLLDFYSGEEIKEQYKIIEKELKEI
ncbi:MAG: hypothetical protein GW778_08105 [Alphaproteobacteria bacterium]|nr:hypothetical protein [Alphaproteobacteria bacterium]